MQRLCVTLAILAMAAPAMAQEKPLVRPNRDAEVQYRSTAMPAAAVNTVTMHFGTKGSRLRIDAANGSGYVVYDLPSSHMLRVTTETRKYTDRVIDPSQIPLYFSPDATFVRTGTATFAGIRCTTYDATVNQRSGQLCLTDDGLILHARTGDRDHYRDLEAVSVSYALQPNEMFDPPLGYENQDILDAAKNKRRPMADFGNPNPPMGSYWGAQSGR